MKKLLFISLLLALHGNLIAQEETEYNFDRVDAQNGLDFQFDKEKRVALCNGIEQQFDDEVGDVVFVIHPELLEIPDNISLSYEKWNWNEERNVNSTEMQSVTCQVIGFSYNAFSSNKDIKTVILPPTLKDLSYFVFSYCENLEKVVFKEGIDHTGETMFANCPKLKSVSLPSSIKEIRPGAFSGCPSVTELTILATTPPTRSSNSFDATDKSECTLYVPKGCAAKYRASNSWKDFKNIKEL